MTQLGSEAGKRRGLRRKCLPPVTSRLNGGLGNQLFQYFAGAWLAHRLSVPHRINVTFAQFGRSGHQDWLEAYDLPDTRVIASKSETQFSLSYIWQVLLWRFYLFTRSWPRASQPHIARLMGIYDSKNLGYDPELANIDRPRTLVGYFQTHRYVEELRQAGVVTRLNLRSPSSWHISISQEMSERQVLSLHIRRGDYIKYAAQYGLLAEEYYLNAIELLRQAGQQWDEVFVFSDEPESVERECPGLARFAPRYIVPPPGTHSAESLDLMSRSASLVIGNSTFSWWAANFAEGATIVRPSRYFKGMDDPADLFPPGWLVAESKWTP